MKKRLKSTLDRLKYYSDQWWYLPLSAILAGLDAFILIIPIEALLVTSVLAKPKNWWKSALWISFGSAVGATLFAALVGIYGFSFLHFFLGDVQNTKTWRDSQELIHHYGGWGLALISVSPFPQQGASALVGLAHLTSEVVFVSILFGRSIKYLAVSGCILHLPHLFSKRELNDKS